MIKMLLHEKPFSILLGGNFLSRVGDGVHDFIFIITVLKVTGSNLVMAGIIYFFRFIPYLVLGPLGGALADRLKRKSLMLNADIARMFITTAFCSLLISDQAGLIALTLVGMLMTAFRTIFQPAFQAAVPSLVSAQNLPTANAATQIVAEAGGLVGPGFGAAALAIVGHPGLVLLLDAATYLISAICVWLISVPSGNVSEVGKGLTLKLLYSEFWQNIVYVRKKSQLYITIVYSSICILLVGGALRILIPMMLKSEGYSDSMIGYAMSLTAVGAIVGAVGFSKIANDFSTRSLMLYWCLYGIMLSILPVCMSNMITILVGCCLLGGVGSFVDVILPTNIYHLSNEANLGKNFSLFSTLANTGEALSGSFAGLLVLFFSVSIGVTVIGLLIASTAYIGRLSSVRAHE
ncbi:MFS transporter [Aquitalea sp. LB_tupeE]|nr:MFS transporter [Aquitalea sp. LB_tupeE]